MRLTQFLADVAVGSGPVGWETWFPVSVAAQSADEWQAAWRALSFPERAAVLDRLRADGSVFADTLLQLAARQAAAANDPPFEELLLADAGDAAVRQTRALEARLGQLQRTVSATQVEQSTLTARISDLEGQLSRFLADNVGSDYGRMLALEQQVAELTEQSAALSAYDWDGQEAERTRLSDAVVTGQARQSVLEEELARLQAGNAELGQTLEANTVALTTNRALLEQRERDNARATQEFAELERRLAEGDAQAARVTSERARLTARLQEVQEALGRDRAALEELRRSPVGEAAERLTIEIDALFRQLPTDQADSKFPGRPTN